MRKQSGGNVEPGSVRPRRSRIALGALLSLLIAAPSVIAQEVRPVQELTVAVGNSQVVTTRATLERVSIGDPEIADAVVVAANEVVVNGKQTGTTTLLLWDQGNGREIYTVRVTADAPSLEREFARLFPGENIDAAAMGNTVILTGEVADPQVARKAVLLAQTLGDGITVMDHMSVPERGQILLQVRIAEVAKNAMEQLGVNILRVDPFNLRGDDELGVATGTTPLSRDFLAGTGPEQTFSDAINFFLFHESSKVGVFIQALKQNGLFKTLAEPNLLAMPAESASFLAGGEFPYPVIQGSANNNAVTIQFKEFGIRLDFVPDITNSGAVRLWVKPEVSALDFANGLELGGFRIPSLISRRAETVIELQDGQTFAIAGLIDNSLIETINKVPLLGDIPILGYLFRSKEMRQKRSELLVLVTPRIVYPQDEAPPIPTGEPDTWMWDRDLRDPPGEDASEDADSDS